MFDTYLYKLMMGCRIVGKGALFFPLLLLIVLIYTYTCILCVWFTIKSIYIYIHIDEGVYIFIHTGTRKSLDELNG